MEDAIAASDLAGNVEEIQGRIIILPMANYPAARDGLRTSSIDQLNLNRIFPGNPNGSISEMIADYVENTLFELTMSAGHKQSRWSIAILETGDWHRQPAIR